MSTAKPLILIHSQSLLFISKDHILLWFTILHFLSPMYLMLLSQSFLIYVFSIVFEFSGFHSPMSLNSPLSIAAFTLFYAKIDFYFYLCFVSPFVCCSAMHNSCDHCTTNLSPTQRRVQCPYVHSIFYQLSCPLWLSPGIICFWPLHNTHPSTSLNDNIPFLQVLTSLGMYPMHKHYLLTLDHSPLSYMGLFYK